MVSAPTVGKYHGRRRGRHERPPVAFHHRIQKLLLLDPLPEHAGDTNWEPGGRPCRDRIAAALIVIDAGSRLVFRQQAHLLHAKLETALTTVTGLFAACLISVAGALLGVIGATPVALAFGYCAAGVAVGSMLSVLRVVRINVTASRARRRSNRDPLTFGLAALGGVQTIPLKVYTQLDEPIADTLPFPYDQMSSADAERSGATLVRDIQAWLTTELGSECAQDTFNSLVIEFNGTIGELVEVSRDLAQP